VFISTDLLNQHSLVFTRAECSTDEHDLINLIYFRITMNRLRSSYQWQYADVEENYNAEYNITKIA